MESIVSRELKLDESDTKEQVRLITFTYKINPRHTDLARERKLHHFKPVSRHQVTQTTTGSIGITIRAQAQMSTTAGNARLDSAGKALLGHAFQ